MGICWEDENKRLGVDFHKSISQSTWVVSNWNWPQLKKNSKDIQKNLAKFKQSFRSWRESWRYSSWEKITPEPQNRSGRMVVGILRSEPFIIVCFGTKIILSNKTFLFVQNTKEYYRNDMRSEMSSPNCLPLQRTSFNHFSSFFFLKFMFLFLSLKMLILQAKINKKRLYCPPCREWVRGSGQMEIGSCVGELLSFYRNDLSYFYGSEKFKCTH